MHACQFTKRSDNLQCRPNIFHWKSSFNHSGRHATVDFFFYDSNSIKLIRIIIIIFKAVLDYLPLLLGTKKRNDCFIFLFFLVLSFVQRQQSRDRRERVRVNQLFTAKGPSLTVGTVKMIYEWPG